MYVCMCVCMGFPSASVVKNLSAKQGIHIQSLSLNDPLKEEVATHSNILAWEIPWTAETDGLQLSTESWTRLSN